MSLDSVGDTAMWLPAGRFGVRPQQEARGFVSKTPSSPVGQNSLLFNWYEPSFLPGGKAAEE
jgi:hypothetical protein